jgi:hypothetical protein
MRPKPSKPTEPLQPLSPEELDAQLRTAADEMIATVKAWHAAHPEATLSEIEAEMLKVRQQITEQMTAALIEAQPSRRPKEKPLCPTCGRRMRYKDAVETSVQSQVGVIRYSRGYYYCPHCKSGLFPPGSPTGAAGGGV